MANKKVAGKQAVNKKVAGASDEKEMLTLTAEHLAMYPELAEKGFAVGQEIEVTVGEYSLETEEAEDTGRSEEDEASMKAEPTGKFIVRMIGEDGKKFRLYNEFGQAVSPICEEVAAIQQINKQASRANALLEASKISAKAPKAHTPTVQ